MLAVIREAFGARPVLDPPADASAETLESVRERLAHHGGLLAQLDGRPVGALVFDPVGDTMFLRRFGVVPAAQGRGVARDLVATALRTARERGAADVAVVAREELPETIRFWEARASRVVARDLAVRRAAPLPAPPSASERTSPRPTPRRCAASARTSPGGCGPVTWCCSWATSAPARRRSPRDSARGWGSAGRSPRRRSSSPGCTPARSAEPPLVHVDAYRLGGLDELDDLDLDARSTTPSPSSSGARASRRGWPSRGSRCGSPRSGSIDDESRTVRVTGVGPRWESEPW